MTATKDLSQPLFADHRENQFPKERDAEENNGKDDCSDHHRTHHMEKTSQKQLKRAARLISRPLIPILFGIITQGLVIVPLTVVKTRYRATSEFVIRFHGERAWFAQMPASKSSANVRQNVISCSIALILRNKSFQRCE